MNLTARLDSLHCYPLKSARGIELKSAVLGARGLTGDREWMIVDQHLRFLTQRELPQLALLHASCNAEGLQLQLPGRAALHVPCVDTRPCTVRVWKDQCAAFDAGDGAAKWLSAWLQHPSRLVRFDPQQHRLSSSDWTAGIEADNAFSDGFPLLVIGRLTDRSEPAHRRGTADGPFPSEPGAVGA